MASANNPKINTNDNPSYTNMKYSLMSNNSNNSNVHRNSNIHEVRNSQIYSNLVNVSNPVHTTAHFGGQYQN
jgi:hypothetical protein